MFRSVLFPHPEGPVTATNSPAPARNVTSTSAAMLPSSNERETWSTTTSAPPCCGLTES